MDASSTRRKLDVLERMTVARGCTEHEAKVAAEIASRLRKKLGFAARSEEEPIRQEARVWRKPPTAAGWEWRQCYKRTCHCMKGGTWHGPYRYRKRRRKHTVSSVYGGK